MFLCALDGKLYNDEAVFQEIVFLQDTVKEPKEINCKICCLCYGMISSKYKQNQENKYLVPQDDKIKVYKISSTNFCVKDKKDSNKSNKDLIKILDNCKKELKKKKKTK